MSRSKTQEALNNNLSKTTKPTKRKNTKKESIKFSKRKDLNLFPHGTYFPWRLDDKKDHKTCWFTDYHHVLTYLNRYNLQPNHYNITNLIS